MLGQLSALEELLVLDAPLGGLLPSQLGNLGTCPPVEPTA